jgi:hypothetical protein
MQVARIRKYCPVDGEVNESCCEARSSNSASRRAPATSS